MQHPVGYTFNPATGRAELTDFWRRDDQQGPAHHVPARRSWPPTWSAAPSSWVSRCPDAREASGRRRPRTLHRRRRPLPQGGPHRRRRHPRRRPRRRRHRRHPGQDHDRGPADEDGGRGGAVRVGARRCGRPLLRAHRRLARRQHANPLIEIPGLLRFLATATSTERSRASSSSRPSTPRPMARGNALVADAATSYVPNIPTTYWTFRLMIGVGMAAAAIALAVLWLTRKGRAPTHRWLFLGRRRSPAPAGLRQLLRLDLHRGRPPAVARVRPDDHRRRRVARGLRR